MLTFKMDASGLLEVTETIMSATTTKVAHWYFDTRNWLASGLGLKNETPKWPMREEEIQWVKQHYLPKVQTVNSN
ncbi:hypothetical protein WJ96_04395 [Burkholderia ubonensis]|uniref:Uncharacterized protein n=1 Tax=Burkholderia ubonensis TaxID=101571 RepID=A0AAW3MXU4_9BURK|nr:hypothetical protein [Burkholderia ubonensis]KVP65612.1 hypothetical protein WJ93_24130 [Burkholderia ubonensis]KVP96469.1 hypothetical protein WJ97_11305 [Burkholderia ubonensis]KVP97815.1 hypothetical protein WJ96_04395 [Burkholderia ubonensis]KVZ92512.1 hypothetical protein WL25_16050 [Burkholderia ubonensis]